MTMSAPWPGGVCSGLDWSGMWTVVESRALCHAMNLIVHRSTCPVRCVIAIRISGAPCGAGQMKSFAGPAHKTKYWLNADSDREGRVKMEVSTDYV